jgi:hypothetical protein
VCVIWAQILEALQRATRRKLPETPDIFVLKLEYPHLQQEMDSLPRYGTGLCVAKQKVKKIVGSLNQSTAFHMHKELEVKVRNNLNVRNKSKRRAQLYVYICAECNHVLVTGEWVVSATTTWRLVHLLRFVEFRLCISPGRRIRASSWGMATKHRNIIFVTAVAQQACTGLR